MPRSIRESLESQPLSGLVLASNECEACGQKQTASIGAPPLVVRTPTARWAGDRGPTWRVEPRSAPEAQRSHATTFRSVDRRQQTSGPIFFACCGLAATRATESGRSDLLVHADEDGAQN